MPALKRLGRHVRANVVAYLALFVALGGTGAYAANTIGSADVIDDSLLSQDIKNAQIKNADIAPEAVSSASIKAGQVQTSDLGDNSVKSAKIADGNVASPDLSPTAVTGSKVRDESLTGADVQESTLSSVPDANTLDGLRSIDFLGVHAKADDSEFLDGRDSSDFLGAGDKAADAELLDGRDSTSFARFGGTIFGDGTINQGTGFTAQRLSEGEYQVTFPNGSLSSTLCPPVPVVSVFSGFGGRYAEISARGCSGSGGGSFTVKTLDGNGVPHDVAWFFIVI